jgi:hypothetical protein
MHVVDVSGLENYRAGSNDAALVPVGTFGYANATKILTITLTSVGLPAGHAFGRANIEVFDRSGGKKVGKIDTATGNTTIDLDADNASGKPLDLTREINIKITVATDKGLAKNGWFYGLQPIADAAGNLGFE